MNSHLPEDDRDSLAAYVDGNPDAVRAAAPREPSEAEWDAVRWRIHARLASASVQTHPRRMPIVVLTALATVAAALVWFAFPNATPKAPQQPEHAHATPVTTVERSLAPAPRVVSSDPLAEFVVLPMATAEEVVLHRIPGDGWFPVGTESLPDSISLATSNEVKLEATHPAWPSVTVAPDAAPMIFAAKPR